MESLTFLLYFVVFVELCSFPTDLNVESSVEFSTPAHKKVEMFNLFSFPFPFLFRFIMPIRVHGSRIIIQETIKHHYEDHLCGFSIFQIEKKELYL